MKKEKWILDGEEVEIPLVNDSEIERNNIDDLDLDSTMEIDESEYMEEIETDN